MYRLIARFICWSFLLFVLCPNEVNAQSQISSEADLKKQGDKYFHAEKYAEALPDYSRLLSLYPNETTYNYRFGVCLLLAGKEKANAATYLEKAIKDPKSPEESWYYLGRSYLINNEFIKAKDAFQKYKSIVNTTKNNKYEVDEYIRNCESGAELIKSRKNVVISNSTEVPSNTFYNSFNFDNAAGKIVNASEEFLTPIDRTKQKDAVMLMCNDRQTIFISSYGLKGENGKDIFILRKTDENNWSTPENLGPQVNSTSDEDFPYLDKDGKTLYFSSKGHNSIGGYDIFKSVFDFNTGKWSEVENMGIPINTVGDDFLYIADNTGRSATYATNVESSSNSISIRKITMPGGNSEMLTISGTYIPIDQKVRRDARITILTGDGSGIITSVHTDPATGKYDLVLSPGQTYMIVVEGGGYLPHAENFELPLGMIDPNLKQVVKINKESQTEEFTLENYFASGSPSEVPTASVTRKYSTSPDSSSMIGVKINNQIVYVPAPSKTSETVNNDDPSSAAASDNDNLLADNGGTNTLPSIKLKSKDKYDPSLKGGLSDSQIRQKEQEEQHQKEIQEEGNSIEPSYDVNISNAELAKMAYDEAKAMQKEADSLKAEASAMRKSSTVLENQSIDLAGKADLAGEDTVSSSKAMTQSEMFHSEAENFRMRAEELDSLAAAKNAEAQTANEEANEIFNVSNSKSNTASNNKKIEKNDSEIIANSLSNSATDVKPEDSTSANTIQNKAESNTANEAASVSEKEKASIDTLNNAATNVTTLAASDVSTEEKSITEKNETEIDTLNTATSSLASIASPAASTEEKSINKTTDPAITQTSTYANITNTEKSAGSTGSSAIPISVNTEKNESIVDTLNTSAGNIAATASPVVLKEEKSTHETPDAAITQTTTDSNSVNQDKPITSAEPIAEDKSAASLSTTNSAPIEEIAKLDNSTPTESIIATNKTSTTKNDTTNLNTPENSVTANTAAISENVSDNLVSAPSNDSSITANADKSTGKIISPNQTENEINQDVKVNPDTIPNSSTDKNVNDSAAVKSNETDQLEKNNKSAAAPDKTIDNSSNSSNFSPAANPTIGEAPRVENKTAESDIKYSEKEIIHVNPEAKKAYRESQQKLDESNKLSNESLQLQNEISHLTPSHQRDSLIRASNDLSLQSVQMWQEALSLIQDARRIEPNIDYKMGVNDYSAKHGSDSSYSAPSASASASGKVTTDSTSTDSSSNLISVKQTNAASTSTDSSQTSTAAKTTASTNQEENTIDTSNPEYPKYAELQKNITDKQVETINIFADAIKLNKKASEEREESNKLLDQAQTETDSIKKADLLKRAGELKELADNDDQASEEKFNQSRNKSKEAKGLMAEAKTIKERISIKNTSTQDLASANTPDNSSKNSQLLSTGGGISVSEKDENKKMNASALAMSERKSSELNVSEEDISSVKYSPEESSNFMKKSFSIGSTSFYTDENQIPMDPTLPDGLVFKVQIGAFHKPLPAKAFNGIQPVSGETTRPGWIRYCVGLFKTFEPANLVKNDLKKNIYKDAFVVAYFNGKRIDLNDAYVMLKGKENLTAYKVESAKELAILRSMNIGPANSNISTDDKDAIAFYAKQPLPEKLSESRKEFIAASKKVDVEKKASTATVEYSVQLGVYNTPTVPASLSSLQPVLAVKLRSNLYRLTTGKYADYNAADSVRKIAKEAGVKDPYIVEYKDGKVTKIDNQPIAASSKEQADDNTNSAAVTDISALKIANMPTDSISKGIVFAVQIGAYKNNVPYNLIEAYMLISDKGITRTVDNNGLNIFYVGRFEDFYAASDLRKDVISKGVKDAFVVALKNGKKIPISFDMKTH